MKSIYFTTPIYYANAEPHVGHLYSTLIADIWKKACVLLKKDSFFTSGLDEHGQKVAQAALQQGLSPQDYTNSLSFRFIDFFESYRISFDKWVRTTDESHKLAVQHFWKILKDRGHIYKGSYVGWYAVRDEAYYLDSELVDGKAPTGADVVWMEEECYYFKLSSFQSQLKQFFLDNPDFIFPKKRLNEALGFLQTPLRDLAISRPKKRLTWGISVPDDPEHVIYVWIDALVNYLSSVGYPDDSYKQYWPATHIIGKDILKFHAIYWPAMLLAAGIELPKKIIAHGWWLRDNAKISKSLGNAVDLEAMKEKYTIDGIRYFLIKSVNIGEDGQFKEDSLHHIVTADLANGLGNTFLRVIGIFETVFGENASLNFSYSFPPLCNTIQKLYDTLDLLTLEPQIMPAYAAMIVECIGAVNEYLQVYQPWKQEDRTIVVNQVGFLLNCLKQIAVLAYPIIPCASEKLLSFVGCTPDLRSYEANLPCNFDFSNKPVLFPKK